MSVGVGGSYANVLADPRVPDGSSVAQGSLTGSVFLELDSDGNGVSGDVTLVAGSLAAHSAASYGALGNVEFFQDFQLAGGAGALSGSEILWGSPVTLVSRGVKSYSCSGDICALLGLPPGSGPVPPSGEIPEARFAQSPDLGRWILDDTLTQVVGSTRAVFTVGGFSPPPALDEPAEWFVFGPQDLGFVPEPGGWVLIAAALAAFAAAQRAATARESASLASAQRAIENSARARSRAASPR